MEAPTHYRVLGVGEFASRPEIKAAWRTIAKACHPDNTNDPRRVARFKLAVAAKEVLLDDDLRDVYDHELSEARMVAGRFSRDLRQEPERKPAPRCARCGSEVSATGCVKCALMDLAARRRASQQQPRKPRRKRRVKIDLEPVLDELRAREAATEVPAWETDHADADSLLSGLLERSVTNPMRRPRRGDGPRVEIHVSPEMVVVLDQSTFDALHRVNENMGMARKMVDIVRRWALPKV